MSDYYQRFFEHNISSVFICELRVPIDVKLPIKTQVRMFIEHTYIKDVNSATLEMLYGSSLIDKSTVIGTKVNTLAKEEELEGEDSTGFQFYKNFVESNYDSKNLESNITPPIGESKWFLVSMKGIIEDGYLVGYWGSQLDITELKKLNKELEIVNKELNEKIEEIEGFAYLSSHNLQTPLYNLQNYSSILNKKYINKFDGLAKTSLGFINDSANKISNMLKRLVYYFTIEKEPLFEKVDTEEVIDSIRLQLESKWGEDKNRLISDNLPTVIGNKKYLCELFSILIENAIVHNSGKKDLQIKVIFENPEGEARFKIVDNGIGIPLKNQSKIFKINISSVDYSKGMGLAVAKKIVRLHKGRIWVQSTPNEETIFYFALGKLEIIAKK